MHPLKRNFMPQMENRKRYHEVQNIVSPNPCKNQKPFTLFKDDSFMRDTLAEAQQTFYNKQQGGKPMQK